MIYTSDWGECPLCLPQILPCSRVYLSAWTRLQVFTLATCRTDFVDENPYNRNARNLTTDVFLFFFLQRTAVYSTPVHSSAPSSTTTLNGPVGIMVLPEAASVVWKKSSDRRNKLGEWRSYFTDGIRVSDIWLHARIASRCFAFALLATISRAWLSVFQRRAENFLMRV